MFTVKLMKGESNSVIKIVEAREVEIRMHSVGGSNQDTQHGIIVTPFIGEQVWYYVGNPDWEMAVIENAAGKTTEIVRAEHPTEYASTPRAKAA